MFRAPLAWSFLLMALTYQNGHTQALVTPKSGMVIDTSVVLRPGTYRLASDSGMKTAAITIRGQNVTVDFNGVRLEGSDPQADPDTYAGVGVLVDAGSRVTIRNATIRGYRVGILARRSPDLHVTRNDLSYNWKQRLYSGIEKESLVDWMSYHQNEKDEWLRYGAAIYLVESDRAEIDHNTVVQGQNGLMVTRSSGLKIWNNTFQFLSSIGVGLYRVGNSTVMHNRIDWCVRGYSHGFYNRGQDSAGLLMYEQSSDNRVAYNSITHGGDGLFLWAGQSTMDTGQGGSNGNAFYGNDFSHAAANGVEATFSRNVFISNRIEECWHGVWGGYSYDSQWILNRFARNTEAIAIEHGQNNAILNNAFDGDETAIRLWQNATQDPNWGYPKNRDTRSRGYSIDANTFLGHKTAIDIRDTADVRVGVNRFERVSEQIRRSGTTDGFETSPHPLGLGDVGLVPPVPPIPGGIDPMIKSGQRRGRNTIVVDEWGPYDWKSPKLWPAGKADEHPLRLKVLGPDGDWKVSSVAGATVFPQSGKVPGEITVTPTRRAPEDFIVALEYRGVAVTSPRGLIVPAGQPYRFEYSRFFAPIDWHLAFYEYADATHPLEQPAAFAQLIGSGKPVKSVAVRHIDYISGSAFEEGVPRDRFALSAEARVTLPAGEYTLQVISDDGVRIWVDDVLVIDAWAPHESRVDAAPLAGGSRKLRLEYYEVGGFAELRVNVLPRRPTGAR